MRPDDNPMQHPEEPAAGSSGVPHFGRLFIFLLVVVMLMGLMAVVSAAYFSS